MIKFPCDVLYWTTLVAAILSPSAAYPAGAPSSVCDSMTPPHGGAAPQSSAAPYNLVFNIPCYQLNTEYNCMLVSNFTRDVVRARNFL